MRQSESAYNDTHFIQKRWFLIKLGKVVLHSHRNRMFTDVIQVYENNIVHIFRVCTKGNNAALSIY